MIKGKLTHGDAPLVNAEINIKNAENSVSSILDYTYTVTKEIRDVIQYNYPSLETAEIIVEDVTTLLNIDLKQNTIDLVEVVVKKFKVKSQHDLAVEYFENTDFIKTGFQFMDTRGANYTM